MPYNSPEEPAAAGKVLALPALRAIRPAVAGMREALLGTEMAALESCMPGLERAVILMEELSRPPAPGPTGVKPAGAESAGAEPVSLRRELTALRADLQGLGRLANRGAGYCQGLARLLGAASGGYTPGGEGSPLRPPGNLLVRG